MQTRIFHPVRGKPGAGTKVYNLLAKKNPRKAEDYNGRSINIKMLTIDEARYFA